MRNIIIDEEFRLLLPALDAETFRRLEENILENGCRDALVLWGDVLIDGHNRYEICSRHDIPFETVEKEFDTREEALIWIISTQVSRRNLTPLQLSNFRGMHYLAVRKLNGNGGNNVKIEELVHNEPAVGATAEHLAKQYKVARSTIKRDAKVAEAIAAIGETSPEARRMILTGETAMTKKELNALTDMTKGEIEMVATRIEEGTYEKGITATPAAGKAGRNEMPYSGISTGLQPLNAYIRNVVANITSGLPHITNKDERSELKTSLKSCIGILEALHDSI